MIIIPSILKEKLSAIRTFNKIINPKDRRYYVKHIYCTGENGRLIFTDGKAIFAVNTEFDIEKGYYTLSKVGNEYALIPSSDINPEKYPYPEHEDFFSMCKEVIEPHYTIDFSDSGFLSYYFLKFSHLLSNNDYVHMIDIKYFQMLPESTYEVLIERYDGHPNATHFKNAYYEAVIMPMAQ